VLWKLRLEGSFWSTPTLVGNQLICCADNGLIQIVDLPEDGSTGSVVSKVDLKEKIQGSPAAANGAVYVRSLDHLIKFK
jgi:outer membrane protein assembly factor BamB